jgi:hypothetical protein
MEDPSMTAAPTPAPAPAPRRSTWDVVLTSTPVALTVIATILAGLSSGEMTRAQYHRSLAAQYQSKTSDEWAYFQAKKARATLSSATANQMRLQSTREGFSSGALTDLIQRDRDASIRFTRQAGVLLALMEHLADKPGDKSTTIRDHAKDYRNNMLGQQELSKRLARMVEQRAAQNTDLNNVFRLLQLDEWPSSDAGAMGGDAHATLIEDLRAINPEILNAFENVDKHKPKSELEANTSKITEDQLRQALEIVESHVAIFDQAQKQVGNVIDQISSWVDNAMQLSARAREGAEDIRTQVIEDLPEDGMPDQKQARTVAEALAREAEISEAAAARRSADFAVARLRYSARRYESEARYNQVSAWLLEIQVAKSGLTAERHRYRSSLFFFGMLAAQAGVTIATLALALRTRSPLWALATLVGLAAAAIGGYVYLFI